MISRCLEIPFPTMGDLIDLLRRVLVSVCFGGFHLCGSEYLAMNLVVFIDHTMTDYPTVLASNSNFDFSQRLSDYQPPCQS